MLGFEYTVNISNTTERPPASAGILSVFPVTEIRGDLLIWDASGECKEKPTPRNLLERFCVLYEAPDEEILKFARSSGPLGHCEHGRMGCCSESAWHHIKGPCYADSVEGWRRLSAIIAGLCRAAARVSQLRPSLWSDWLVYPGQATWPRGEEPWRNLSASRMTLAREVTGCLELGHVRPGISWHKGRWEFHLRSHLIPTLYGELAQQLMLETANIDGMKQCDGCGKPFMPNRRPDQDRRSYCHDCHKAKIPQRDANRDKRTRDRAKRLLTLADSLAAKDKKQDKTGKKRTVNQTG